jgi:DNA-directed RNA polymerase subunit RPC12/RpoP
MYEVGTKNWKLVMKVSDVLLETAYDYQKNCDEYTVGDFEGMVAVKAQKIVEEILGEGEKRCTECGEILETDGEIDNRCKNCGNHQNII